MKRALVSVTNKEGIVEFAKGLEELGFEVVSTGGTYKKLLEAGVKAIEIDDVTGFPEILDGRVKTLHPLVHAGILAIRDNEEHMNTLKGRDIHTIDYVVVNLYPFFEKVKEDLEFEEKVEPPEGLCGVGVVFHGPAVLRAFEHGDGVLDGLFDPGAGAFVKIILLLFQARTQHQGEQPQKYYR